MKRLTPKQLSKLEWKDQLGYDPIYKKYKKVRRKDYCEECGHFEGYHYEEVGIGKPIYYVKVNPMTAILRKMWYPKIIEGFTRPNPLVERMKKNERP